MNRFWGHLRTITKHRHLVMRHCFKAGIPYDHTLLGYRFKDDHYEIEPEEAETVRRIYEMYLSGKGIQAITNELNHDSVPTRFGLTSWYIASVQRILRNYTYTGNLILQKTFRENHLTKKKLIANISLKEIE